MTYKWEKEGYKIPAALDKRRKLTEEEKQEIRDSDLSQRKLAAQYGVSRRLIQFIKDPEKLEANKQKREERGGSKAYYDKEKHTESIRRYRKRKQKLFKEGKLLDA